MNDFNKERECNSSRAKKRSYFTGFLYKIRGIENMLGCENARTALVVQFDGLSRVEFDARSNLAATQAWAFMIGAKIVMMRSLKLSQLNLCTCMRN